MMSATGSLRDDLQTYNSTCEGEGPCFRMSDCRFSTTCLYASSARSTREGRLGSPG